MNVTVPESYAEEFWREPQPGHEEFWKFRFKPPCQVHDVLWFRINKKIIASAVVAKIVHQRTSYTDAKGARFAPGWLVYWRPETFIDRREETPLRAEESP